jgi:hypothetical protein
VDYAIGLIHEEMRLTPARLLGAEPDVYNAYDRLDAEAELRVGVATPLLVISIPVAFMVHPLAATAIGIMAVCMFVSGVRRLDERDHLLLEALRAKPERLDPSLVEKLEEFSSRIENLRMAWMDVSERSAQGIKLEEWALPVKPSATKADGNVPE